MPIVDIASPGLNDSLTVPDGFAVTPGEEELNKGSDAADRPSLFGAAMRDGSSIVAALSAQDGAAAGMTEEPGFNPWDAVKGTKYEARFDRFADISSGRAADARKRQIDQELEDDKVIDAAPWYQSLPLQMVAGIADWTTLLPGGAFVRGAKGGFSIGKSALTVGGSALASTAVQETALHRFQQTRTWQETAAALGASTVLGSLLGAGGAAAFSRGAWSKAVRNVDLETEVGSHLPGEVFDDISAKLKSAGMPEDQIAANAAIVSARYKARAERLGADPVELYRGENIGVRAGEDAAAEFVPPSNGYSDERALDKSWRSGGTLADLTTEQQSIVGPGVKVHVETGKLVEVREDGSRWGFKKIGKPKEEVSQDEFSPKWTPVSGITASYVDDVDAAIKYLSRGGDRAGEDAAAPVDEMIAKAKSEPVDAPHERDPVKTPEFMNWSGGAPVVKAGDAMTFKFETGRPIVVEAYHGTNGDFEVFDATKRGTTTGAPSARMGDFSTSDPAVASSYADTVNPYQQGLIGRLNKLVGGKYEGFNEAILGLAGRPSALPSGANVKPIFVRMNNPLVADFKGSAYRDKSYAEVIDGAKAAGHDGVVLNDTVDEGFSGGGGRPSTVYVSFAPEQIKSVHNRGTFDPKDPRILYQPPPTGGAENARGRITFGDSGAVVDLFAKADQSTFMHEMGHKWLQELMDDAADAATPQALKDDLGTVLRWLGVDKAEDIKVEHHEKWATGFEQYLRDGKAPSPALARAFEQFKEWLTTLYKTLTGLGEPISDDVRGVMDRLLATDAEIAAARSVEPTGLNAVGAAATTPTSLQGNSIAGRAAGVVAGATARLNPLLRGLVSSPSPVYRDVLTNMVENSVYLKKNYAGVASATAVETLMKEWNGGLAKSVALTGTAWPEYRKAGGQLSRQDFRDAVGRAMRRGDEDADPFITKVAKEWRKSVFDPLKKAAIDVGLLPPDVTVDTAASYFSRIYNRQKMIAQEGRFKQIVQDYYAHAISNEYDKASEHFSSRLGRVDQEIADLQLAGPERAKLLEDLPAQLKAMRTANKDFEDLSRSVGEFHSQASRARDAGDTTTAAQHLARAKEIADAAGDDYASYITNRNALAARARRIRNNIVGRADQVEQIRGHIADTEAANVDRLWRMHRSIALLEEEIDRGSPEQWGAKLSDLRTQFAQVLERSNKEQERLTQAKAKKLADGQKAAETGDADAVAKIDADLARGDPFMAEAKRIAEMTDLAGRIDDLSKLDPEETLKELRRLIEMRLSQTAEIVEYEGRRIGAMAARLDARDPKIAQARVESLRKTRGEIERRFFDRWETKNLGEGVDPASGASANFTDAARAIADSVYATLTGRVDGVLRPDFLTISTRGPMKERTFNVPDKLIEDFLESDVEEVGRRYVRVMGSDVELARKFGTPDMAEQVQAVRADYARLRQGVTDEAELLRIGKREKSDVTDMESLRDLLRGGSIYNHPVEHSYARLVRSFNHINYIRSMGEVVLASITDAVRPAMVHGLGAYMGGVGQLLGNLSAVKLSVEEAQLAGNVVERVLGTRLATISEISDPYASRGPIEAFLENMTNFGSKWNGIRIWTDGMKSIASVLTQNRILENVAGFSSVKASERHYLAFLGIDEGMAGRIAAQFTAHGETIGSVRVANTTSWTDDVALRTYRAAMNKDIDSIIVVKGVADTPLFANTPTGRALLQFKSFTLASHQRVLLRGLQEDQSRFIGGAVAMTAMGMLITYLKAISGNRPETQTKALNNPGWWIGEGLDRSGVLAVPMEFSNAFEKMTGLNPMKMKTPIEGVGTGGESQKNQNRSLLGAWAGPTGGLLDDIGTASGVPGALLNGKKVTKAQKNAAERLLPFNSYAGMRQILKYVVNPPVAAQ